MNAREPAAHPDEATLRAYALGHLDPAREEEAERHALTCARCAARVSAWRDDLVAAVEALPAPARLPPLRVEARRPPRRWAPPHLAWAAALAGLLALAGTGWGGYQTSRLAELRAEQAQVTRWLARPDLRVLTLRNTGREPSGRALTLPGGRTLFVLPDAPPGQVYVAWVARDWHLGDPMQPAGTSRRGVFEVNLGPNDYLCVSLEADGTLPAGPTRVLGWAFL